jgi:sulfonate transport system permease protein
LPTAINLSAGLKSVNPTIMLVGQNLVCGAGDVQRGAPTRGFAARHLRTQSRLGLRLAHHHRRRTRLRRGRRGPTFFTNDTGDFLLAPELLAGLLTIALAGVLVEATFRLLERRTVVRWGMKAGRE